MNSTHLHEDLDINLGYYCVKNNANEYCGSVPIPAPPPASSGQSQQAQICNDLNNFLTHLGCCAGTMLTAAHELSSGGVTFFNGADWSEIQMVLSMCNPTIPAECADTPSSSVITGGSSGGGGGGGSSTKTSAGATAGIVIGVLVAVALIGLGALFLYNKHQKSGAARTQNLMYDYASQEQ